MNILTTLLLVKKSECLEYLQLVILKYTKNIDICDYLIYLIYFVIEIIKLNLNKYLII